MIPPPVFPLVVIGSTLADGAVAALALFRRADPPVGVGRLLRAAACTSAAFVAKLALLVPLGLSRFGWVHLVYVDLVVLVPVLGVALLAVSWRPRFRLTPVARGAAVGSLLLAQVGVYATFFEPYSLRLETARLVVAPAREGARPLRVGVLTDIQTNRVTDHEHRAVALLNSRQPDLVVIPGDVFQGTPEEFEATRGSLTDLLASIDAPGGVYAVLGDTDGPAAHLRPVFEEAGVRLLVNEAVSTAVKGRRITVGGVELAYDGPGARGLIERMEADPDPGDLRLLVAHRPDVALGLKPGSRIDLLLAGHTHGGQVVVPGYGPPMTLSRVPRGVAAGGLHAIGGNPVYVSRGVGFERGQAPRLRFLCPPEVSVVELVSPPPRP